MTNARKTSRRRFLRCSASVAAASAAVSRLGRAAAPVHARSTETLRVGLIGCGGRGTGAAFQALSADDRVELTAMADLFEDNLRASLNQLEERMPDKVRVAPERRFLGFGAYQDLIDSEVDVVLLATPPGFRAPHLKAAVEAGKHVFAEITAAVDAPGVRSVLASAELAQTKGLAIVSGFCWRYNAALRAAVERIRQGAIGPIRAAYSTYYRGGLSRKYHGPRTPEMSDLDWQIRDWYDYLWLSGDVTILLSGGHSVDKMSWWLDDAMPARAVALGSRVFPSDGNTFDNAFVAYEYADGVRGFLGCRSHAGCYCENADYIIGAQGICTIGRGRSPVIEGRTTWRYDGPPVNMYQTEHDELFASIRAAAPINDGFRMARTTLMAIMGRMAAYTGKEVTWEQALHSQQTLVPDKLDWDTRFEQPPRATPGLTPLL